MRAIVGTAGHIDHGKTALVRALTGIETDRLPEERARGISIELGFAHLDLPEIGRVGVVDVPGHERFIRQMLAGAHGFDLVVVVVAADDGVMPQTEEHFDIVHLLGVRRAIFAITKSDLAAPERLDEVRGEIEILAAGTPFEDAPVVAVSARTGEGIERLRAEITTALSTIEPRPADGPLRIPVDRAFVLKGHGVVVTGTALQGTVSVGDELVVLPEARPSGTRAAEDTAGASSVRVREIQVHGEPVRTATAGQRVALNLAGVQKDDVVRGQTVASRGVVVTTLRLDARIEVRPSAGRALASHVRVRVHHGTRETHARLVWLDGLEEVKKRASAFAQLALEEPLVAAPGDRFVIRDETASRTLGGGVVLLARATRHRRAEGSVSPALRALEEGDAPGRLATLLEMAPGFAMDAAEASAAAGIPAGQVGRFAKGQGVVALAGAGSSMLVAAGRLAAFEQNVAAEVAAWQEAHPNLAGVDVEHLRGACRPHLDARVFRLVLDRMVGSGKLERSGSVVSTRGHAASLGAADEALARRMFASIEAAGFMPPVLKDLAAELDADRARLAKIAAVLVLRGQLVKAGTDLFFSRAAVGEIRDRLRAHLREHGEIAPAGFRDLIAASRKYCIPLLDLFDREGLTIRVGDLRKLRQSQAAAC